MELPKVDKKIAVHKPRSHPLIFVAAVALTLFLVHPFITPLILSVITAYVLRPIVKRLEVHTRSYHLALGLIVAIISVPIILSISYLSSNTALFLQDIREFGNMLGSAITALSEKVSAIGFGEYADYILGALDLTAKITSFASGLALSLIKNLPLYILDFLIYIYATYHFMRNGHRIITFIKAYAATLPSEDEHFLSSIMRGLKRSFDVLFLSYITMSLIIAVTSLIGYTLLGVPHAFILSILTGLFGFLPIFGAWMIYVPAAAYMYYAGNTLAATGLLLFGVIFINIFIPVILQPYLGSRKSGVSQLTIFLGFFSGPLIFGAGGLLIGPILFVIAETVIVEYMKYRIANEPKAPCSRFE